MTSSRAAGLALGGLRRHGALGRGVRDGIAQAATAGTAERARRRLPHGGHRRALRALPGRATRCITSCARTSRSRRTPGQRSARTPPALASDRKRPRHAARGGQGLGDPGDRLRQQRRVALHLAPLLGGRRDRRCLRTGWLGRYLDAVGTLDNPLQGLSLDTALQPALATAKMPVATLQAADQYTFAPPGLPRTRSRRRCSRRRRTSARRKRPRPMQGLRPQGRSRSSRTTSTRSSARSSTGSRARSPTRRRRPVPAPARRARGDGLRRAAAAGGHDHRARPVRHARFAGGGAVERAAARRPTRCSRSSATSKPAGSRIGADVRVVGVRPPRRRERVRGDRPRLGRIGFLIGTRVNGQMVGGFPGVDRRPRQPR